MLALGPQTSHQTDVAQGPARHPLQGIHPNCAQAVEISLYIALYLWDVCTFLTELLL